MNSPLNVALCDLNHTTVGLHTETMPLAIGLLGAYLASQFGTRVDVRLFKFVDDFEDEIKTWKPDVLGFSLYSWNTNLNLEIAQRVKRLVPSVSTIVGGPNVPLARADVIEFFEQHPFINFICKKDGELPLANIVGERLAGKSNEEISKRAIANIISPGSNTGDLIEGEISKQKVRLEQIPSPYLTGLMDKFFGIEGQTLSPFIETNRGCPFTCTFCHTSDAYYNKPQWTSSERLRQELTMFGRHFRGRHEVRLFMADNNFGSFNEDLETAEIIRETQEKFDWPRYIDVTTGKTRPDRIVKTIGKLKWGMMATASLQTLTPTVLKRIKRKNLNFDDFIFLQQGAKKEGSLSQTELIMSLPGETRDSFLDTLKQVFDAGIEQITVYTLMNLRGTPLYQLHRDQSSDHIIKYRIVPRQFGKYSGKKIFDIEEVVVGTPTFSFDDYLYVRGFSAIVQLMFNGSLMPELIAFLREKDCSIFDWVRSTYHLALADQGTPGSQLANFLSETKEELWESEEEIKTYYESEENFSDLLSGKAGKNLLSKYSFLARFEGFEEWLELSLQGAKQVLEEKYPDDATQSKNADILKAFGEFFATTRNLRRLLAKLDQSDEILDSPLLLDYDIVRWMSESGTRPLETYYSPSKEFSPSYTPVQRDNIKNLAKMGSHEREVKLQFMLKGYTRDLWPACSEI